MPCYFPMPSYDSNGTPCRLPCGQCIGCRLEYSRQWAIRCVHEAQMHNENCFITLTYNDDNLPTNKSVSKIEMSKFIRSLRKNLYPKKIRFFGSGEYGEKLSRPHYHICIFGHCFDNYKILRSSKKVLGKKGFYTNTESLYRSKLLEKIWKKGWSSVGELTFQTSAYTARYICKKITGSKSTQHYKNLNPEFALMSRNPGIGTTWFEKYSTDVYPKDFLTKNGIKFRPPKFYDYLMMRKNPDLMLSIKQKRKENQNLQLDEIREMQRSHYKKLITKTLIREYERSTNVN